MSQDDITKLIALGIPILMIIFSIVGRIWCYISDKNIEKVDTEIQKLQSLNSTTSIVSEAIKKSSVTTKEATESFKKFKEVMDKQPLTSTLYADNTPILTVSQDETIERISPPKEYCQCEYCGTFYNEFVSNCKNCGAQIRMPSELYKPYYIIKANSKHNLFDI